MLSRPCLKCGTPVEGSRCDDCRPPAKAKGRSERGYAGQWPKLSRRARRLQPWCSDCHTTDDLTADHSPEAWRRHEARLPIRLQDVDVVCRTCNSKRGAARGPTPPNPERHPHGKALSRSHTCRGYA